MSHNARKQCLVPGKRLAGRASEQTNGRAPAGAIRERSLTLGIISMTTSALVKPRVVNKNSLSLF
jgi:hypothetical protein